MEPGYVTGFRIRVGVDVVAVSRIERLLTRYPAGRERLFTTAELEDCWPRRLRYESLAARFAAKEAVLKAFGTGLSGGVRWKDVQISQERSGRPTVVLEGRLAELAERDGLEQLEVSLSHGADVAVAQAVTVWQARQPDER